MRLYALPSAVCNPCAQATSVSSLRRCIGLSHIMKLRTKLIAEWMRECAASKSTQVSPNICIKELPLPLVYKATTSVYKCILLRSVPCCHGKLQHSQSFISSGSPSLPTLSCVDLSWDTNGTVAVNVSWTLDGGDSADFYLINITTNDPDPPYGGLLNITTPSVTLRELTGFQAVYEYITVYVVSTVGVGRGVRVSP